MDIDESSNPVHQPRLPYPDGWFAIAFSDELPRGKVIRRKFMGEELVAYRTRSGAAQVVDAHCPHLGAHLGFGGSVDGENIVCPFHHFAYDLTGKCVRTGDGSTPPRASLKPWASCEVNGFISVWRHAGGSAPTWQIPTLPVDEFPPPTRRAFTLVDHPQDVFENTVDLAHFAPIHGFQNAMIANPLQADGPHLGIPVTFERAFPLLGSVETKIVAVVHGLGCQHLTGRLDRFGADFLGQAMATPIDPVRVQTYFTLSVRSSGISACPDWAARTLSQILTQAVAPFYLTDVTKDFHIWSNKKYVEHPKLSRGDGPIMEYRRWARQFYSAPHAPGQGAAPEPEPS
ncbi:Rieske 2Fe-2S domain-containing protein [Kitasatospora sp. NPDC086801]|uniref:Rieske 2Fe-2S domain-containing protein n=1 Tax=Kitasatospora sp. NPDC086801 TaxID=3364066 RepID=UPI0038242BBD